jgi:hypothetical protein
VAEVCFTFLFIFVEISVTCSEKKISAQNWKKGEEYDGSVKKLKG